MTHPSEKSNFYAFYAIFSIGMYFFYEYIQMTLFNTIPQQLLSAFHISAFSLGKLSASYFLAQITLLLPAGILLDRFSVKRIVMTAMLISISGTLLFSFSHSYTTAVIARVLSGIGGAFAFLSCIKITSQLLPNRMPLITGLLITLAIFGGFIAQAPLAWFADHYSWREGLQLLFVFGLLIFLNIAINVKNQPPALLINTPPQRNFFKTLLLGLSNLQTLLAGFYISFMNLPIFILGSLWGGIYLEVTHHFSHLLATFVASTLFIGVIAGSSFFGFLAEKVFTRRKIPMLIGTLLSLLIAFSIIEGQTQNTVYLSFLFFFLGFASSAQCIGYSVVIENNTLDMAATASGIASIIIMGGGALMKILYSWILDMSNHPNTAKTVSAYSGQAFQEAMWMLPTAFLLALLVIYFLRETHGKNQCGN